MEQLARPRRIYRLVATLTGRPLAAAEILRSLPSGARLRRPCRVIDTARWPFTRSSPLIALKDASGPQSR